MRMLLSALAAIAFGGLCSHANAQAQCPELTRLRGEALEAQQPMRRGLGLSGCEEYIRSSLAWRAVLDYAGEHRELCNISEHSLNEFEKYHREAAIRRDNVCAGPPVRAFPAEIILAPMGSK